MGNALVLTHSNSPNNSGLSSVMTPAYLSIRVSGIEHSVSLAVLLPLNELGILWMRFVAGHTCDRIPVAPVAHATGCGVKFCTAPCACLDMLPGNGHEVHAGLLVNGVHDCGTRRLLVLYMCVMFIGF